MLLHQLWLFGLGWVHTGMCLLSLPTCFGLALYSNPKLYKKFFCWVVDDVTVNWLMLLHQLWLFGLGWLHTGTCLLSLPVCARLALDNYPKLYNKFFVGLLMMLLLLSWCCSTNYDYLDWDECTLVCVSCHCQRALVSLFIVIQNFTRSFFVGLLMM